MATYQKHLEQHLSHYRRDRLGVAHCGTFRYKGADRSYGHILPRELRWLNVPEPFRAEIRRYTTEERIQLHRYFHHLNSSQAFTLGLFYPYLTLAKEALSAAIGVSPIRTGAFEVVPERSEGTNVDVVLRAEAETSIYCEVKLSELGFGTAVPDERHCRKIEKIYRPRLNGMVDPELLSPKAFCGSYQILRNLWHAASNPAASVLFFFPKQNESLGSELQRLLPKVGVELMARTRIIYVEDVLDVLAAPAGPGRELRWYAAILREKYVPRIGSRVPMRLPR
jgi:restriction endonuclease-like protein